MQDWILLLIIFLLGALVTIVFFLINKQKLRKISQLKTLSALGFVRADRDMEMVTGIVRGLSRDPDSASIRIENLFEKAFPDGKLYLLDVVDRSDSEKMPFGKLAVLLVSREMNLPRFSIYPKMALQGRLGDLTNTLLETVYSKIGNVIKEWNDETFEERYAVISDQEDEVRQVLSTRVIERLNGVGGLAMECDQNHILINQFDMTGKENKEKAPAFLTPMALKIHGWFMEYSEEN